MKKALLVSALTLALLAVLDGLVASVLTWADRTDRLQALVRYFEYGRSIPGKLEKWEDEPEIPGNLYDVAWRSDILARSRADFEAEAAAPGPVIRSYGMSFVNNILRPAAEMTPGLAWDAHSGPGAPPNFTYAVFEEDRANRRPGDIAVFGILSSAIPAMAALSNRTWVFEQPAPFTYPVYWPDGDGLRRVEPLINSAADERALSLGDPAARAWHDQLAEEDLFYGLQTFGATWLDASPFMRLVRRSLATTHVAQTKRQILAGERYPYAEVLVRMIAAFAEAARAEGLRPVVFLIQSNNPGDADLLSIAAPVLGQHAIPYLATSEHFDPRDPTGFVGDGHYRPEIDRLFAEAFLALIE